MARRAERPGRIVTTDEEVLDPSLEIVDPHHHLWDNRGSTYLLEDLLDDTGRGHNVVQTVYIECGWAWDRGADPAELIPVPEVAAVVEQAAESVDRGGAVISGIVGHVDLRHGRRVGRALDAMMEAGGEQLVGIRHVTAWDEDPAVVVHRTHPFKAMMADPTWREGFAEVAARGLAFDAWLYHPQLPELADLARAHPDTTVVVDHLGGPLRVGRYAGASADVEVEKAWRAALVELARYPNVSLKLGGIGMPVFGEDWHTRAVSPSSEEVADRWGDTMRWCIETFGVDRCMFESNYPVDAESCSYVVLWNAFKRIAAGASPHERAALFAGTARRVYRLPSPSAAGPR